MIKSRKLVLVILTSIFTSLTFSSCLVVGRRTASNCYYDFLGNLVCNYGYGIVSPRVHYIPPYYHHTFPRYKYKHHQRFHHHKHHH